MQKKTLILIPILLLSLMISVNAIPYDSWNNYRILNFDDGFEGLQVNFNVTYGFGDNGLKGNCREDFEDLRFFDYLTDELLFAYNETTVNSDYCEIWLKLGSSKNVTMRYNNPEAESYWDLENTFNDVIDDVVLALPMDEGSGSTVYDYSGLVNDGVVTNPHWVDGKFGSALNFTGSDYVTIAHDGSLTPSDSGFSFGFWVYQYEELIYNKQIFTKDDSAEFGLVERQSSYYKLLFSVGGLTPNVIPFTFYLGEYLNDWHFVSCVYDEVESSLNVYFDGVLNNTVSVSGSPSGGSAPVFVATHKYIANFYEGVIDNLIVSNSSWDAFEVLNMNLYYSDFTIVDGSLCCRVWVDVMPIPIFDIEFSNQFNDAILIAILALIVGLCALLLVITKKK